MQRARSQKQEDAGAAPVSGGELPLPCPFHIVTRNTALTVFPRDRTLMATVCCSAEHCAPDHRHNMRRADTDTALSETCVLATGHIPQSMRTLARPSQTRVRAQCSFLCCVSKLCPSLTPPRAHLVCTPMRRICRRCQRNTVRARCKPRVRPLTSRPGLMRAHTLPLVLETVCCAPFQSATQIINQI
jgi:hypothetical protein